MPYYGLAGTFHFITWPTWADTLAHRAWYTTFAKKHSYSLSHDATSRSLLREPGYICDVIKRHVKMLHMYPGVVLIHSYNCKYIYKTPTNKKLWHSGSMCLEEVPRYTFSSTCQCWTLIVGRSQGGASYVSPTSSSYRNKHRGKQKTCWQTIYFKAFQFLNYLE